MIGGKSRCCRSLQEEVAANAYLLQGQCARRTARSSFMITGDCCTSLPTRRSDLLAWLHLSCLYSLAVSTPCGHNPGVHRLTHTVPCLHGPKSYSRCFKLSTGNLSLVCPSFKQGIPPVARSIFDWLAMVLSAWPRNRCLAPVAIATNTSGMFTGVRSSMVAFAVTAKPCLDDTKSKLPTA